MEGAGHRVSELKPPVQGNASTFFALLRHNNLAPQATAILTAMVTENDEDLYEIIPTIDAAFLADATNRADLNVLMNLYRTNKGALPPAPPAIVAQNVHRPKSIQQFASQYTQLPGMHPPVIRNLFTAVLIENNLPALIAVLAHITCQQFPRARFGTEKEQSALLDIWIYKNWMANPESFGRPAASKLRALLQPDDDLQAPLDERASFALVWEVFGMVTEPEVAGVLAREFEALNASMLKSEFGSTHFSRDKLLSEYLKATLGLIQTRMVPVHEDILVFINQQINDLIDRMEKVISDDFKRTTTIELRNLRALVAQPQQGFLRSNQSHTRQMAVPPGPGTQPTLLPAASTVPLNWGEGEANAPHKPPGLYPAIPHGLVYPGQPCFAWVGKYCHPRCKNKNPHPHEWGNSTAAQKTATSNYALLIKPHNVYNIWKSWIDNGSIPENFPHRITN